MTQARDFVNGPRRSRTCDPLIKSLAPPRPARAKRHALSRNGAERFMPPPCVHGRAGAEPRRSASSWLQDGCRMLAGTARE